MKKIVRELLMTLLLLWQLPQIIVGVVVWVCLAAKRGPKVCGDLVSVGCVRAVIGVSFGPIVLLNENWGDWDRWTAHHEKGHSRQSVYLGPLYLLVVGVPSLVMNFMSSWSLKFGRKIFWRNYYKRWPERWADKLGGVKRLA